MKQRITIEQLKEKLVSIQAEMQSIQDGADAQNRALNAEEVEKFAGLKAAFEATEQEIERREDLVKMAARLDAPGTRVVMPEDVEPPEEPQRRPKATPGVVTPISRDKGTGGFISFGEFAMRVKDAVLRPNQEDSRLKLLNLQHDIRAAATTFGQEGVGADGGYA